MTTLEIFEEAGRQAKLAIASEHFTAEQLMSNGSEAWQSVQIRVDGRTKIGRDLKRMGIKQDYYWGFLVSPKLVSNYYKEEAWTNTFARVLNENGISAHRVERLL